MAIIKKAVKHHRTGNTKTSKKKTKKKSTSLKKRDFRPGLRICAKSETEFVAIKNVQILSATSKRTEDVVIPVGTKPINVKVLVRGRESGGRRRYHHWWKSDTCSYAETELIRSSESPDVESAPLKGELEVLGTDLIIDYLTRENDVTSATKTCGGSTVSVLCKDDKGEMVIITSGYIGRFKAVNPDDVVDPEHEDSGALSPSVQALVDAAKNVSNKDLLESFRIALGQRVLDHRQRKIERLTAAVGKTVLVSGRVFKSPPARDPHAWDPDRLFWDWDKSHDVSTSGILMEFTPVEEKNTQAIKMDGRRSKFDPERDKFSLTPSFPGETVLTDRFSYVKVLLPKFGIRYVEMDTIIVPDKSE